ncbi:hypothetical protein, unlikely [Trypanosoma brucei gambiense DAL972]|uniref:Uncharacterized protein n=1 Tax=Trypanosoma brucei gambiense (strain MHOM/CI/86/DAL972) TaxID=679716 RepID=D0A6E0_TRYB9|nr:hypothetical protein, unlikely [Trypanosoma brucei gambiense DAL972]CBH17241.1 hypothetical protein, unlikely [Trypanosoma brucei gambiense DAL972]|eukprot:XP_011779505.1 hypothetical protein, unlikely [Trypanosoma brucei gambiense DAL972]
MARSGLWIFLYSSDAHSYCLNCLSLLTTRAHTYGIHLTCHKFLFSVYSSRNVVPRDVSTYPFCGGRVYSDFLLFYTPSCNDFLFTFIGVRCGSRRDISLPYPPFFLGGGVFEPDLKFFWRPK